METFQEFSVKLISGSPLRRKESDGGGGGAWEKIKTGTATISESKRKKTNLKYNSLHINT